MVYLSRLSSTNFTRTTLEYLDRGGSRTAATSKMERFVIIVNGFQPRSASAWTNFLLLTSIH